MDGIVNPGKYRQNAFMAIPARAALQQAAARLAARLGDAGRDARWTAPEDLHLTLAFMPAPPPDELQRMAQGLQRICRMPAFQVPMGTARLLARTRNGRGMVWAVPRESPPQLLALQRAATELAGAAAPDAHRKFSPHVTLARAGRAALPAMQHAFKQAGGMIELEAGDLSVTQVNLYTSTLMPHGARYSIAESCKLD